MSKIVVIGANHAGTAAVNTILDTAPDQHQVVVFDANSNISFLGCGMALWIGGQISGPEGLFYSSQKLLQQKGALVHMLTTVTKIDFDRKIVYAEGYDHARYEEPYEKLILATGSQPIIPDIPGKDLENVQLVKRYQDADEVIQKLHTDQIQKVAVIGAGYIGVELAEAFKRNGKEVVLIDCAPTCLSGYYDSDFTSLMSKALEKNGVQLAFGESVTRIEGTNRVEKILTDQNEYDADMAVLAVGFRPNSKLGGERLERFRNGAYRVNRQQRTNLPDVYAIGDCTGGWMLYRKQYKLGAILTAVMAGIYFLSLYCSYASEDILLRLMSQVGIDLDTMMPSSAQLMQLGSLLAQQPAWELILIFLPRVLNVVQLVIMIITGIKANEIYRKFCTRKIKTIDTNFPEPADREMQLRTQGGVNTPLAVGLMIAYMLAVYLPRLWLLI